MRPIGLSGFSAVRFYSGGPKLTTTYFASLAAVGGYACGAEGSVVSMNVDNCFASSLTFQADCRSWSKIPRRVGCKAQDCI